MKKKVHSGTFVLRIDPDDHKRLKEQAHREGISLNQLCARRLNPSPVSERSNRSAWTYGEDFLDICLNYWTARDLKLIGIVLFGSAARGQMRPDSDIDLLLVLETGTHLTRELYRDWDHWENSPEFQQHKPPAHEVTPQFVSLPLEPLDAGSLWFETAIDGVVLWEKELRVSRFLRKIREKIADGSIIRATSQGHPYWIRKRAG